jgi:dipeptidase E
VKLYLSSFRLGRDRGALRDLVGRTGRAALVFNACDVYGDGRLRNLERETQDKASLGFECEELDLRSFFEDAEGLRNRLDTYDLLWVVGGNSFVLARAMTQSRFGQAVSKPLGEGRLVYAGYSAGTCVTAPDLEGIRLMDEPDALPDGYRTDVQATTLGLVPWRIVLTGSLSILRRLWLNWLWNTCCMQDCRSGPFRMARQSSSKVMLRDSCSTACRRLARVIADRCLWSWREGDEDRSGRKIG